MPARTVGDDRRRARPGTARGDVRSARASQRRVDPPSTAALATEAVEAIIPVSSSARRGSTTGSLHRFRSAFLRFADSLSARSDGESRFLAGESDATPGKGSLASRLPAFREMEMLQLRNFDEGRNF
jgi:hypothetical protein